MSWDITIRRADGESLGDLATVRKQIAAALPGVEFYSEDGDAILASLQRGGVEITDDIRDMFESKTLEKALYEGEGYSFEFYGLEDQPLRELNVGLRGSGDAISALAGLCGPHGWVAVEDGTHQPIDLASGRAPGWDFFRGYVNRAVETGLAAEDADE
jgi:hypothetical protein